MRCHFGRWFDTLARTIGGTVWKSICLIALCLGLAHAAPATGPHRIEGAAAKPATSSGGNKLLIVAPEASRVQARQLAAVLGESLSAHVSILAHGEYAPGMDERAHDGFIYLGSHYPSLPPAGFLRDVATTTKPVLWIGYHGWLLGEVFLRAKGLRIQDRHSTIYTTVVLRSIEPLPPTDTTWVEAPASVVLYWLYDASRLRTLPGAVRVDGFTFVSYFPSFDTSKADYGAFLAALRATFESMLLPRTAPVGYLERVRRARADPFRTGIHLPIYTATTTGTEVGYDSDRLHARLARIKATGAEWVTLSQIYFQHGTRAIEIHADAQQTPSFAALRDIVRDAHALGLMVRLSVVVNLADGSAGPDDWRGSIRPAEPDRWWRRYREVVLHAARFARDAEIESFNLGAELNSMQRDDAHWRELVQAVRTEAGYRGLIGYQPNFNALDAMPWAQALDYLAIAAYWPLATTRDPTLAELSRSWQRIGQSLLELQRRFPRVAIELGEIGYASQPYASVLPYSWKPDRGRAQNLREQLSCYQALEVFLATRTVVAGVHFFASTMEDFQPQSIGYTPFGKPAADVMTRIIRSR